MFYTIVTHFIAIYSASMTLTMVSDLVLSFLRFILWSKKELFRDLIVAMSKKSNNSPSYFLETFGASSPFPDGTKTVSQHHSSRIFMYKRLRNIYYEIFK